MSLDSVIRKRDYLMSIDKTGLNAQFPKEFELYVCGLELIDANGKTLRYFVFPIMPSSIKETYPQKNNIKQTLAGITSLNSTTFTPVEISLSGNFGRKFKILLGEDYIDFINSFRSDSGTFTKDSIKSGANQVFDQKIKTGYGSLNVLKDIIDGSKEVDDIGPRRLILYNPAFGTSYVVKVMSFNIDMSQETNMIHNYYVSFKAIATLDSLKDQKELQSDAVRLNTTDYLQKQTNRIVNTITSIHINLLRH